MTMHHYANNTYLVNIKVVAFRNLSARTKIHRLTRDGRVLDAAVLLGQSVAVCLRDIVVVALVVVLAGVGSEAAVPWAVVECAVGSLWLVVLADDVGDEEVHRLVGLAVRGVALPVCVVLLSGSGTLRWVVWAVVSADTDVGVALVWSVDGTWKSLRAGELGLAWWWSVLDEAWQALVVFTDILCNHRHTVGTSNHNVEVSLELAIVGCGGSRDWQTEEGTLDDLC